MSLYLLSARMHSQKGYDVLGRDTGPHRPGIRLVFHSHDGEYIDKTDLAVAYSTQDGKRNALLMREIQVDGLFPIASIPTAAELLSTVSDAQLNSGRFPQEIQRQLNHLAVEPESQDAEPDVFGDLFAALKLSIQKNGCVYVAPEGEQAMTKAVMAHILPKDWAFTNEYRLSIFWDMCEVETPFEASDVCDLNFSYDVCPTKGPAWRFDDVGQLTSGTLPDPPQPPEPASEQDAYTAPRSPKRPKHRVQVDEPAAPTRSRPPVLPWLLTALAIAIATAVLALACHAELANQPVVITFDFTSLKSIFCLIYGLVVGWLIGRRKQH